MTGRVRFSKMATRKILTPQFISVFFAQFSLSFSYNLLVPTLPIYLASLGSREETIGLLIGALSLSSLILRPVVGKALVRIPERRFMLAGALIYGVTSLSYIWAPPFWPFFIVRILQGIATAFFYTASVMMVVNISLDAHRGESLSYFYTAFNFAFAIAPIVGMYMINLLNFTSLFLLCTALSLLSLALTVRLPKRAPELVAMVSGQTSSLFSLKALHPSVMSIFLHTLWGALTAFFPLYSVSQGVANPGFFFGALALTLIVGRMFGGRIMDRTNRERIIFPCITTYILSMVLLAFSKSLPMFILVAVIWGIGSAFLFPALLAYTVERAGAERGPAIGTFSAAGDLGIGLGSVIMGIVLRLTDYRTMFLCLALIAVINLGYFHYFMRDRSKSP